MQHPDFAVLTVSWELELRADGYTDDTVKAYQNAVRGLADWLAEHHPEVGPAELDPSCGGPGEHSARPSQSRLAEPEGGAMEGWARVAWLVGLVALLVLAWRRRRWRGVGGGAPPGSRVARYRHLYEAANSWPWMALTSLLLIANAAGIASHDPTGRGRVMGGVGIVLGAIALAAAVGALLLERHWNRRRSGDGTDRPPTY